MKKNKRKRVLSMALVTVMLAGTIAFAPQGMQEVKAAATTKNVNLATSGFINPTSTGNDASAWTGSKVYYGGQLWRVLDAGKDSNGTDGAAFLLSDEFQGKKAYNDQDINVTWASCTLRTYLNGTYLSDTFASTEQDAIKTTDVVNDDNPDIGTDGGDLTYDKLFLLSLAEVQKSEYGFGSNATRAASSWWRLRTPGYFGNCVVSVNRGGSLFVFGDIVDSEDGGIRPAFNLNLDSVLFSSASAAGKSFFASVGDDQTSANTWKLTLKDGNESFAATRTDAGNLSAGTTVCVNVSSLGTAGSDVTYDTISGMLVDASGTVLCYGKANETFGTGTGDYTFAIPAGVTGGARFYVFAEDVSQTSTDVHTTDYASNMVAVYTTPSTYVVTVNNGTGDGDYAENATVTITAEAAPSGQEFDKWTVVSGGVTLASATSATTTFEMPANAVEVTATYKNKPSDPTPSDPTPSDPTPSTPTYTITTGVGGTHELSTDGTLTITCDGALDKLTGIYVDGNLVDTANYTLKTGSTILTFNGAYLKALSAGTHKVKFQYSDGSVETTFAIKEASTQATTTQATTTPSEKDEVPKTGDSTPIAWLFVIALISGASVVCFGRKKKTEE